MKYKKNIYMYRVFWDVIVKIGYLIEFQVPVL